MGKSKTAPRFFDRGLELADIQTALKSARSELRIVYGRRGAGKSTLFDHAFGGTGHFSYTCAPRVLALQLADIERALNDFVPGTVVGGLRTFDDFLTAISGLATPDPRKPLIAVIDELPYLAREDPGVLGDLQRWFNAQRRAGVKNIKMFLLGSMVSWMQEQALSDTAALKSVRTGQLAVHPLNYRHAAGFYSRWAAIDKVRAFGIWGSLPGVLEELPRGTSSLWSSLKVATLTRGAKLYDEPNWLKYTDLRAEPLYTSLVRAVASGERRPSDIAARVLPSGSQSQIQPYLEKLRDAQVLSRRAPLLAAGERPRSSLYYVDDQFLAYWYRFVDPEKSLLDRGLFARPLARIKAGLDKYISEDTFESVSRAYLWEALEARRLPRSLEFDRVGGWWSGSGQTDDEADVVAFAGKELTLIGECKWTNSVADENDLHGLDKIMRDFKGDLSPARSVWRALFSRSGFSAGLERLARDKRQRILLVSPADLYW